MNQIAKAILGVLGQLVGHQEATAREAANPLGESQTFHSQWTS